MIGTLILVIVATLVRVVFTTCVSVTVRIVKLFTVTTLVLATVTISAMTDTRVNYTLITVIVVIDCSLVFDRFSIAFVQSSGSLWGSGNWGTGVPVGISFCAGIWVPVVYCGYWFTSHCWTLHYWTWLFVCLVSCYSSRVVLGQRSSSALVCV